jgi:hypothetical protein
MLLMKEPSMYVLDLRAKENQISSLSNYASGVEVAATKTMDKCLHLYFYKRLDKRRVLPIKDFGTDRR